MRSIYTDKVKELQRKNYYRKYSDKELSVLRRQALQKVRVIDEILRERKSQLKKGINV